MILDNDESATLDELVDAMRAVVNGVRYAIPRLRHDTHTNPAEVRAADEMAGRVLQQLLLWQQTHTVHSP